MAGLETLVALRALVGHRVALTLVAPADDFTVRALEVLEPFGLGRAQRYPLAALAADLDARFVRDAVARVERDDRTIGLQSGDELAYDVLVLAVGAFAYPAYQHGVCVQRAHAPDALDAVIAELRGGLAEDLAIVMGFALMLVGGGFLVLTLRVLRVFGKEQDEAEPAVAPGGAVLSS